MEEFFIMFGSFIAGIFNRLANISFRVLDFRVDLLGVLIGFSALAIVTSIFWKGGRQ